MRSVSFVNLRFFSAFDDGVDSRKREQVEEKKRMNRFNFCAFRANNLFKAIIKVLLLFPKIIAIFPVNLVFPAIKFRMINLKEKNAFRFLIDCFFNIL